jgi:hypothetical protein
VGVEGLPQLVKTIRHKEIHSLIIRSVDIFTLGPFPFINKYSATRQSFICNLFIFISRSCEEIYDDDMPEIYNPQRHDPGHRTVYGKPGGRLDPLDGMYLFLGGP